MRTFDASLIAPAVDFFLKDQENSVDLIDWVADKSNIALVNEHGDLALFEKTMKDNYTGHYFFKSRGRKAINAGRDFLDEIFNTCYNIPILLGLCPLGNLGARWMSRQLGFTSYGAIDYINDKKYEMFIITKEEYNNR